MISINKIKCNSLLMSMFLCESMICNIIVQFVRIPNISVVLMIFLLLLSFSINQRLPKSKLVNMAILWAVIIFVLLISSLLNGFENVSNYLIYFIAFGTTAAVISVNEINMPEVCKYVAFIFTVYFLIYFPVIRKPFLYSGDAYYADSMGIAYSMMTIVYLAIVCHFYKASICLDKNIERLIYLDSVIALYIILVDCRSRGPVLSIVIAIAIILLTKLKGIKRVGLVLIGGISSLVIFYNLVDIAAYLYEALKRYNIEFSALSKIVYLSESQIGLSNGRNALYELALNEIAKKPITGHGIGYFESLGMGYVHNIFLDILLNFGMIGTIIIAAIFVKQVRQIFRNGSQMLFFVLLFAGEMMLNFSSSLWLYPPFWLLFFELFNLGAGYSQNLILLSDKSH